MKGLIYFLVLCAGLSSCLDTALDATDFSRNSEDLYLVPGSSFDGLELNPYTILGITPTSSGWDVVVEYSGGCENHQFYALWSGDWAESYPQRTTVRLGHSANGDMCEALVRDTVRLDFGPLFVDTYPEDGAYVTLENVSNARRIEVDPGLASIFQGQDCTLKTQLLSVPCSSGIWANKWFKVEDSVAFHDLVWIRPVINDQDISLASPDAGAYHIGLTLLFGYDDSENIDCQALPSDASFVSAAINCITPN